MDPIPEIQDIVEIAPAAVVAGLLITLGWYLANKRADLHVADLRQMIDRLMGRKPDE